MTDKTIRTMTPELSDDLKRLSQHIQSRSRGQRFWVLTHPGHFTEEDGLSITDVEQSLGCVGVRELDWILPGKIYTTQRL